MKCTNEARRRQGRSLAGAILLAAAMAAGAAAAAPQEDALPRLERQVRAADGRALAALQAERARYEAGSPYAHRIAYLKLLRQAHADAGDGAGAAGTAAEIERLARTEGDAVNAAYGALGRIAGTAEERPAEALAALNRLDARQAGMNAPEFTAPLQQAYGDVYLALGQYDFALSHYLHALELCLGHPELLQPTPNQLRLAIAKLKVYTRAPDQVLESLRAIDAAGGPLPPAGQVRAGVIEGIAQAMLGHTGPSLAAYRRALDVARANKLVRLQASALSNMADTYLIERRWKEAEQSARAGLAAAQQAGEPRVGRMALVNLGMALAGQGRLDDGLRRIDEAADTMRRDEAWPDLVNTLGEKSGVLERAGAYRQALAALQEQQDIAARLTAAERKNAMTVLQEQFDAQRRAAENDVLRRENATKDEELRQRRLWQLVASLGAAAALVLCALAWLMYRRSEGAARRLRVLNAELAFHSTHDALTGLLNRRSFRDAMAARAKEARQDDQCFILLDVDHFKSINDRHGHAAGDAVLVEVAQRLKDAVGARGSVLRWGGEEFLVHADGLARAQHAGLVRELLDAVAARPIAAGDDMAPCVTVSAGALSLPHEGAAELDWQQALVLADHALYRAKDAGRHCGYMVDGRLARAGVAGLRLEPVLPTPPASSLLTA
jgi:diguanylate cyclase (GGDEF)-like protein